MIEISFVLMPDFINELFRADAFFLSTQHDGCAMGIIGTHIMDLMATHSLKAHPDIGLHIFHQMANMDLAVGIGQGGGD